jgi:DNA recombination protein RmuC
MGVTGTAILSLAVGVALGWLTAALRHARRAAALESELAALRREQDLAAERAAWTEKAEQQLRETFQALAANSLKSNAETFIARTREQLDAILKQMRGDWSAQKDQFAHLVQPVEKGLKTLDDQVRQLEQRREGAYKTLEQHLAELRTAHKELRDETGHLRTALTTSSAARGQWGELQLRRLVEMAGMANHVDFDEQQQAGAMRPDMTVHLPNAGILPVDAKTSMQAYLQACEAEAEPVRRQHLKAHAQAMRQHVRSLSQKEYWQQFERAPDVVVMFVPNEACLSAGFQEDPGLIEYGLQQHVLIATPVTLFGLLKAIAYGWQQQAVTENAVAIAQEGKQLCDRLNVFLEHLSKTGRGLDSAVKSYNDAVGSLESRLMPSARRLRELGASAKEPSPPAIAERQVRMPADGAEGKSPPTRASPQPKCGGM